jgi:isocitrate dehydrogenase kinase/phosphatase
VLKTDGRAAHPLHRVHKRFARALRQAQVDRSQFYSDRVQETVGQCSGVEVALQPLDDSGLSCSPAASCASFLEDHGGVLSPDFWNAAKARIPRGTSPTYSPIPRRRVFAAGSQCRER